MLNRDDEPGLHVVARSPLATTEAGGQASFAVVLNRPPGATVRLPLTSGDPGEGTVSPAELVFEPKDWDQPQTVTVTARATSSQRARIPGSMSSPVTAHPRDRSAACSPIFSSGALS